MAKERNANLDFFRCILMFLIVLFHSFRFGIVDENNVPWWMTMVLYTLIVWHVDSFIGISGWFGVRFSLVRFAKIWGLLFFYGMLSYAYNGQFRINGGWYGESYLMLLFLSPFINAAIDKVIEMPRRKIFYIWFGMFVAVTLSWMPTHLYTGVNYASSFLVFVYIYITMRLIRLLDLGKIIGKYTLYIVATFILGAVVQCFLMYHGMPIGSYAAPHVVAMSIIMFLLFKDRYSIPCWLQRVSELCAPSMFGVYLCHTSCTSFGRFLFIIPQRWLRDTYSLHPFVIIVCSAAVCFFSALLIDFVRRMIFSKINGYAIKQIRCFETAVMSRIGL